MQPVDLPVPAHNEHLYRLRADCAKAITSAEQARTVRATGIPLAETLRDFFIDCANQADRAAGGDGTAVQYSPSV